VLTREGLVAGMNSNVHSQSATRKQSQNKRRSKRECKHLPGTWTSLITVGAHEGRVARVHTTVRSQIATYTHCKKWRTATRGRAFTFVEQIAWDNTHTRKASRPCAFERAQSTHYTQHVIKDKQRRQGRQSVYLPRFCKPPHAVLTQIRLVARVNADVHSKMAVQKSHNTHARAKRESTLTQKP